MRTATTRSITRNSDTRDNFLLWFIQEFGFNANATTALYDVQMLKDAKTLLELDNDAVANIFKAVCKNTGQSVAKIAATKLKLKCFWIRHQHQTLREIWVTSRPLVKINYSGAIELLQQQKLDEDNWATDNKEPDYLSLTLDTSTATRVFDKVKTLLGQDGALLACHLCMSSELRLSRRMRMMIPLLGKKSPSIPPLTWR
jgi:hypothetical protein